MGGEGVIIEVEWVIIIGRLGSFTSQSSTTIDINYTQV